MEYRNAIVDELGFVMYWCSDLYPGQKEQILTTHPEWQEKCVEVY